MVCPFWEKAQVLAKTSITHHKVWSLQCTYHVTSSLPVGSQKNDMLNPGFICCWRVEAKLQWVQNQKNFLCHLSQNFSQCVNIPCHHISSSCSTGDHITSWLVSEELWKLVGDFLYSLMRSGENLQMFRTNLSSATHQDRDTKQQVFSIIALIEVPKYSTGLNESEKQNFIDPIHLVIWPSYLPANLLDLHKSSGFLKTLGIFPRIICRHDFNQFEVRYLEREPRNR